MPFCPYQATSSWTALRSDVDPIRLTAAFADAALIETANEREEATAIAHRAAPGAGTETTTARRP